MRTGSTAPPQPGTLLSVQYLRAAAALTVVVYHVTRAVGLGSTWPFSVGAFGVDLFFVISGLIMWVTTFERPITPGAFLMRRVRRIVPLYWALTTVAVALAVAVPALDGGFTGVGHVVSSFAFVASTNPNTGTIDPVILPGWTLNYEMVFYLVFAAFLAFGQRVRFFGPVAVLLGLAALTVAPINGPIFGFYTQNIVLEFALGLAVGAAYTAGKSLPAPVAAGCIAAGLVGLVATELVPGPRVFAAGLPSALILAGAVLSERRTPWPARRVPLLLGDASYSIYLAHPFVVSTLLLIADDLDLAQPVFIAIGIPASIGLGLAVYFGVEQPLARRLRRAPHGAPQTAPASPVTERV